MFSSNRRVVREKDSFRILGWCCEEVFFGEGVRRMVDRYRSSFRLYVCGRACMYARVWGG